MKFPIGCAAALLAAPLLACSGNASGPVGGGGEPEPLALRLQLVAEGLDFPLDLASSADDPARIYIAEKSGRIRLVRNGTLLVEPFLDLSDRVSTGGEQGLIGLALAPDFAASGRFIVHYTDVQGDTRVSLFRRGGDPDRADPTEHLVLAASQPFSNHNGGRVTFGTDGYLYVGLGDGGSAGDPDERAQNLGELLGSILRIDVQAEGGYEVPADNPLVGRTDARGEIWSWGLRNPWRFSFDRLTGDLYVADVGQSALEEIDVVTAERGAGRGVNFGWDIMEGSRCFEPDSGCRTDGLELPAFEYGHGEGCSVTGGFVYRGAAIPELAGHYFFADFCEGWVRSFVYQAGRAGEVSSWESLAPGGQVSSFGEDAAGELYVLSAAGAVYRIVRAEGDA